MMRSLGPFFLLLLAACGAGAAPVSLATRADSAGIAIVTSPGPSLRPDSDWQIDTVPSVSIGPRQDGDPNYEFLRVTSGTILATGEIVVLNPGSQQLRFYSGTGSWLRSAGREGDGPGEMRRPLGIAVAGDTVFVRDPGLNRLTLYTTAAELLTSWPYPAGESNRRVSPIYRLADGSWIGTAPLVFAGGSVSDGTTRSPSVYQRIAPDLTRVLDTIATTPGTEQHVSVSTGDGGAFRAISIQPPPFGRSTPAAAGRDRFIWGDNAAPEFRVHGSDARVGLIVRWDAVHRPLTPELIAEVRDANLALWEGNERSQQGIRDRYAVESPAPEVPFFSSLLVDPDGLVWVREYQVLPTDPSRFKIFAPDGQWLTTLTLPPRHTVLEVGREHLLTVWQDDDDLEHVRVYRLRRGLGGGADEGM